MQYILVNSHQRNLEMLHNGYTALPMGTSVAYWLKGIYRCYKCLYCPTNGNIMAYWLVKVIRGIYETIHNVSTALPMGTSIAYWLVKGI